MRSYNKEICRGDQKIYRMTVERDRQPVNLSAPGVSVQFAAKLNRTDTDANVKILKTATVTDGPNGKAQVTILPADTLQFPGDVDLHYDLKLKELSGAITTLAYGRLIVTESVTSSVL